MVFTVGPVHGRAASKSTVYVQREISHRMTMQ